MHKIAIIISLLITNQVFANGMFVSDPMAHSHIIESISELNELKQKAETQIKELTGIKEQMSGISNIGDGINFDNPLSKLEALSDNPLSTIRNSVVEDSNIGKINYNNRDSISTGLDQVFAPIKQGEDVFKHDELKADYKQVALKSTIISSEKIIADAKDRSERIRKLINKINQATSIKESQDLTNLLLAEQLLQQEQVLILMAESAKSEAAQKYHGINYDHKPALRKSLDESWKESDENVLKMLSN
jgi:hypothetical protein